MSAARRDNSVREHWPVVAVPLVALLLVLPLLLHGPSCGHDYGFHMLSWIEVADQFRHGTAFPHWAYTAAYNAGEPRFVFYPPVSWTVGALLLLALPASLAPAAFTFLALTLAGWGMYALARRFTTAGGAVLAVAVYLANPYMMFTAFERTAFAELLAAAWLPWLLRAALAEEPRLLAVALPVALLWLTNAPAAVMGTYALVLIVLVRLVLRWRTAGRAAGFGGWLRAQVPVIWSTGGGLLLGLGLAGFYLLPAAWERRYVEIAMAIIPNMRVEDNFLFGHTGYGPHDQVLHTASVVAVSVVGLAAIALLVAVLRRDGSRAEPSGTPARDALLSLAALVVVIAGLLWRASLPVWHLLPEMAFLQFPWRLLAVLGCVLGAGVGLALRGVRLPAVSCVVLALAVAATSGSLSIRPFRQGCEADELPQDRVRLFATHHGMGPTDEYTPLTGDNDQLRWDDPAWWLAPTPAAPGPHTVPNPAATILDYDEPPPLEQTISGQAPRHLHLDLAQPQDLILNLRDYPAWVVNVNGRITEPLQRDDGLIAVALGAGSNDVEVHWQRLPDVWLGDGVSLCALVTMSWLTFKSRRIKPQE